MLTFLRRGVAPCLACTVGTLPKSQSEESAPSPRVLQDARAPGSNTQALAMDVTKYSSSVFLHPHQLISGWLQRAITAPFFWCLRRRQRLKSHTTNHSNSESVSNWYITNITGRNQIILFSPGQETTITTCKGGDFDDTLCIPYLYTTTGILFQDLKEATLSSSLSVIHTGTSIFWG